MNLIGGKKGHLSIRVPLSSEGAISSVTRFYFHKITPQPLNPTSLTQPIHTPPWSRGAVSQMGLVCSFKASRVQTPKFQGMVAKTTRVDCPCVREGVYIFLNFIMISFFLFLFCYTFIWCKLENKGKPKNEVDFWDLNKNSVGTYFFELKCSCVLCGDFSVYSIRVRTDCWGLKTDTFMHVSMRSSELNYCNSAVLRWGWCCLLCIYRLQTGWQQKLSIFLATTSFVFGLQ